MQGFGQPGFPGFFPGNVPGAGNWAASGNNNGSGPIRRGGRQYQTNVRTGPYDRRPNQRFGGESGRLSPPPGSRRGGMTGGGRWGDGAGNASITPREAVQGRSLKSYEDLDAVAGSGSGELNY